LPQNPYDPYYPGGPGGYPGGPGGPGYPGTPGGPGFPGGFPPATGQQTPPGPPPVNLTPAQPRTGRFGAYRVDPGSLRPCVYRYVYVWLRNGRSFWFYPVFVGPTSTAGYRWNGYTWRFYGVDLNRIVAFECF